MPTISSRRRGKITLESSKQTNFWESGLKFIQTHQNNTEVLEKFSREMEKLSDLARTVKAVTEEGSYSTNLMGFDTTK